MRAPFDGVVNRPARQDWHVGPPTVEYSLRVSAADTCDPFAPPVQEDLPPLATCRFLHNIVPTDTGLRRSATHRANARQWISFNERSGRDSFADLINNLLIERCTAPHRKLKFKNHVLITCTILVSTVSTFQNLSNLFKIKKIAGCTQSLRLSVFHQWLVDFC